jgi:radical SAM superfamily enzyme YgiQ (UPF0313 family)
MDSLRILFVVLYSEKYPSIGESHGASVVAGAILDKCSDLPINYMQVIDMVAFSDKNVEQITQIIKQHNPNVICISVNYGTYDALKEFITSIEFYLDKIQPLILLGGPIPTYIPEVIIKEIYEKAIITIGEGDDAAPMLIRSWFQNLSFKSIPNLCFSVNGKVHYNQRKLVLDKFMSLPYRKHIDEIFNNKGQIYVESSRGCSWSSCSFCLRGLTDLNGRKNEFRRFNNDRLFEDILALSEKKIHVFTFSDEDFLGGELVENSNFIVALEQFCLSKKIDLSFDISLTVHSIFSNKSNDEFDIVKNQLKKLKSIGLRKVFIGIESGSDSQLKRLGKGHSSFEALTSINAIKELNINLELGFIMFDPLCSLREIKENIDFLYNNDLVRHASFISNELRLQINVPYIKLLKIEEKTHKKELYNRMIDYNTISHTYDYLYDDVSSLICIVRKWNDRIRSIHYPLKNISRYGEGGILGIYRDKVFQIVINLRKNFFQLLKDIIADIEAKKSVSYEEIGIDTVLLRTSNNFIELYKEFPKDIASHLILENVLKVCLSEVENFRKKYENN